MENSVKSKVDELGRIEIEIGVRKKLGIKEKDKFEIYPENNSIVLKKLDVVIEKEKVFEVESKIEKDLVINVCVNRVKSTILNIHDLGNPIRTVDEVGRIVLPIELRNLFNIHNKDEVESEIKGKNIILTKKKRERNKKYVENQSSHCRKRHRHQKYQQRPQDDNTNNRYRYT